MQNSLLPAAIAAALALGANVHAQDKPAQSNQQSQSAQKTQLPKGQTADINGAKVHYTVQGQGTPMVLIHGYPLNSGLFRDQVQALSKNHKLVLLDLPGFGKSKAAGDSASLSDYAKTVFGLMDELKIDKAIIGGHSMGGMTTIEMYKMQPERFSGMVLIDTTAKPAPIANRNWWNGFGEQAQKEGVDSIATILVPQMLTGQARTTKPELVKYTEGLVKAASVEGAVGGGQALAERPDNTKVLESVKVPALIIVGQADSLTPVAMSKEMNQAIKGSKLVVIEGASHASVLEEPKRANEAILSWARQVATAATAAAGSQGSAGMESANAASRGGSQAVGRLFVQLDDDKNGSLDKAEVKDSADVDGNWKRFDKDGDGRISRQEFTSSYTIDAPRQ